jgi:plastocyanin
LTGRQRIRLAGRIALTLCAWGAMVAAEAYTTELASVTGVVSVRRKNNTSDDNSEVAIWLKRVDPVPVSADHTPRARLKIVQEHKRFDPHLLVVPVDSVVDFPNRDPFFHNVFSLFDGKRFDLGLYEAGSSRSVSFNRAGICYIFCNIHPEMSAIVVVVDTPYYAVSNHAGEFTVPRVPPGRYLLSVWHDRYKPEHPKEFPREVTVSGTSTNVGVIQLVESDEVIVPHKNKYGHDYNPPPSPSPVYN